MRIGTWNLAWGGRNGADWPAQSDVISSLAYDVLVLTEAPPQVIASPSAVVVSPRLRDGSNEAESWIAICGVGVESVSGVDIPFERMAAAASLYLCGRHVIVYGSVLPWSTAVHQAPAHALAGEDATKMFTRMLGEQEADVAWLIRTHPDALVVWAGDFNQTLAGLNYGGNPLKRQRLSEALDRLGFRAWNGDQPHAKAPMLAVDLVCGPRAISPVAIECIPTTHAGVELSDHMGYIVELA